MQLEATQPTPKATARTAVVTSSMLAPATALGGMSRIDRHHRTAPFFGLVRKEGPELGKRPAMQTALRGGLASGGRPLANIR